MRYGSMTNLIMDNSKTPVPEVGMGATRLGWTDRHPYTVIEVKSPKRIVVQADDAKRIDKNGMSESQDYEFNPNPEGETVEISLRKNGRWIEVGQSSKGTSFLIGHREKYYDYSF